MKLSHVSHTILAYTYYSFCEWFLIVTDVWFDSITVYDFNALEVLLLRSLSYPFNNVFQVSLGTPSREFTPFVRYVRTVGAVHYTRVLISPL